MVKRLAITLWWIGAALLPLGGVVGLVEIFSGSDALRVIVTTAWVSALMAALSLIPFGLCFILTGHWGRRPPK